MDWIGLQVFLIVTLYFLFGFVRERVMLGLILSNCAAVGRNFSMSKLFANALSGQAWSLSELVFDLDDCLDDEGRPVSERRAVMAVRAGVEMDMRMCPFDDERKGQWMNASALTQVSQHYNAAMSGLVSVRQAQIDRGDTGWLPVQAAVIDLLLQPALERLALGSNAGSGRIPALAAVAHKLGAGFFGVMRQVCEKHAGGRTLDCTAEAFLDFVARKKALIGASEVCAGSPQMIRRASDSLFNATVGAGMQPFVVPQARLEIARILALQVQLGTFWRLFDEVHWFQLCCSPLKQDLLPFNQHLRQRLEFESNQCPLVSPLPDAAALPALAEIDRKRLQALLDANVEVAELAEDQQRILELLAQGPTVVALKGDSRWLVQQLSLYLYGYRLFRSLLADLETELRAWLWQLPEVASSGLNANAGFQPGRMIFAVPRALPWYECLVGCRMDGSGRLNGSVTGLRPAARA